MHVRAGVGAHAFAGVGQRTCGMCVRTSLYACMIIILYYYICRRSVYVRVCVSTYVHVNVGLCADECVYTSVREWGAHVRGCVCISVCMCVRVRLRQWGCVCEGMCVRVWALIHVRLRVRARVRAGVRARKYACVIIVLYHYVRAQFVCAHVCA